MVYAFNVSGLTETTPTAPTLKWRIGCPNLDNDTGCTSTDVADIGQTWSSPVVLKAAGYDLGTSDPDDTVIKPMLIMGGGYDASFVGYAPAENPQLLVSVVVDEPTIGSYYGGDVAAPAFEDIAEFSLRSLRIAP